jgi:hypothetical protein
VNARLHCSYYTLKKGKNQEAFQVSENILAQPSPLHINMILILINAEERYISPICSSGPAASKSSCLPEQYFPDIGDGFSNKVGTSPLQLFPVAIPV